MFLELLQNNVMNKQSLLVLNYKKLGLTENQVLIVLLIMNLNENSNSRINIDLLVKRMNLSITQIEDELEGLLTKKLILLDKNIINLEPLFVQLVLVVEQNYLVEQKNQILDFLSDKLSTPFSKTQKLEINQLFDKKITSQEVLAFTTDRTTPTLTDLLRMFETSEPKPVLDSRFNWLKD